MPPRGDRRHAGPVAGRAAAWNRGRAESREPKVPPRSRRPRASPARAATARATGEARASGRTLPTGPPPPLPKLGLRHLGAVATLIPQEAGILEARARENIAFDLEVEPARLAQALYVSAFDAVLREPPGSRRR